MSTRVPSLGLGMRPRGPKIRATAANRGIISEVARHFSNSMAPPFTLLMISSEPTTSAPAVAVGEMDDAVLEPPEQCKDVIEVHITAAGTGSCQGRYDGCYASVSSAQHLYR